MTAPTSPSDTIYIDTYGQAAAALPTTPTRDAEYVLDYSVGDGRRGPVTLDALLENAGHLAEEGVISCQTP